jgi:radical SAM superfamily enzyme YgiQ (UPF0313 family)
MKIILINPPLQEDFPSDSCSPPLGLIAVASVVKHLKVKIIDAPPKRLSVREIVDEVIKEKPDLVGITSMTPTYSGALKVAKTIKNESKVKICIGGAHSTLMTDDVLRSGVFDFVVRGEGEDTFKEVCEALNKKRTIIKIKGISFIKKGKIIHNEGRKSIRNLDRLPFPSYELLPFKEYQSKAPLSLINKEPWFSYCSSRSCPFDCRFCSTSQLWGKAWRGMPAERMANDVEELLRRYSLNSIFFVDDNFTFKRERIIEFCNKVKEKNLKFIWTCNCRVDQVDEELLRIMKNAGCWRIGFGIEAGTQKVLDWHGKGIKLDQAREAIKLCKKVGITQACYFIMGAPIEGEEEIRATIDFAKELSPDVVGFSYLTPYPATQLYDESIKNNWVIDGEIDFDKLNQNKPMLKCGVTPERLVELNKLAFRSFYLRPSYMLKQFIKNIKKPKQLYRGVKTIFSR